jgi:putative lipoic acid-binding regulatory protein
MADETPQLEDLVEFPAPWIFRAVGATSPALQGLCRAALESCIHGEIQEIVSQPSSKGRWTAVRLKVIVQSADEVRAAYAALQSVEGVIKCL